MNLSLRQIVRKPKYLVKVSENDPTIPAVYDDYKTRLLKLIPSEIIASFVAVDSILKANMIALQQANIYDYAVWGVFGIILLLTPFYLYKFMEVKKWLQILLSCIAFIIWVMTLGGPFFLLLGNLTFIIGSILLVIYTIITPLLYK